MATGTTALNHQPHNQDNRNGNLGGNLADSTQEESAGSSYTMASTQSQFSYAVDNWIRGSTAIAANEVQSTRPPQPPIFPEHTIHREFPSQDTSGIWYTLAMILPLLTMNNARAWGCSPSTIFHVAQFFTAQFSYFVRGIHRTLRTLAEDQVARDIFATAMDVILIIYAIGFLVLSMYQASLFN